METSSSLRRGSDTSSVSQKNQNIGPPPSKKGINLWQKAVSFFAISAVLANAGIVLEILARWFPIAGILITSPAGMYFIMISDPLIYFFRAMIQVVRLVGRLNGVKFDEEEGGTHDWQNYGDLLAITFFGLAVALFSGFLVPPPVGITLAWLMGLSGLSVVGYFDYVYPQELSQRELDRVEGDPKSGLDQRQRAQMDNTHKLRHKRLYIALLCGLTLLLICGSAIAFAPPVLQPALLITSNVASLFLSAIAIDRAYDWFFPTVLPVLVPLEEYPDKKQQKQPSTFNIKLSLDNNRRNDDYQPSKKAGPVPLSSIDTAPNSPPPRPQLEATPVYPLHYIPGQSIAEGSFFIGTNQKVYNIKGLDPEPLSVLEMS